MPFGNLSSWRLVFAKLTVLAAMDVTAGEIEKCQLSDTDRTRTIFGEYIINFQSSESLTQLNLRSMVRDGEDVRVYPSSGSVLIRLGGPQGLHPAVLERIAARISLVSEVDSIQPNYVWHLQHSALLPATEATSASWALDRVGLSEARSRSKGDESVIVAVVDSGILASKPDFVGKLWVDAKGRHGASFIDDVQGNDLRDRHGHGTMVAGIVGGVPVPTSDRPGGIAEKLQIMVVRVFGEKFTGSSQDVARGIRYAVHNGADLVNLSLSTKCDDDAAVRRAIAFAHQKARAVVAAAGNDVTTGIDLDQLPIFPAVLGRWEQVTVGATSQSMDNRKTEGSRFGKLSVDLGAPGEMIAGPHLLGTHYGSGTSYSAPMVSGGLILLAPLTKSWTWSERTDYLISSVRKVPKLRLLFSSRGMLDLDRATSAPVRVLVPNASNPWRIGEDNEIRWTARESIGPCSSLEVGVMESIGTPIEIVASGVSTASERVVIPASANSKIRDYIGGTIRLSCQDTDLHAFSPDFNIEHAAH